MTESSGPAASTGLGTLLRHVLDAMDADVAGVLADLGLAGYRPRFSPVVRVLVTLGPLPIRDLARAIGVTHSAASQTVAEMTRRGLATLEPGRDARQRVVHLSDAARRMLPAIEAEWEATAAAAAELDAELPFPLSDLAPLIAAALERRSFRQRIIESGWAREHPWFGEALAAAPTAPAESAGQGPGGPG
ncbi:MAG: MarR family winged helix-turn-helix transcriptional regulator [Streptosporangiaceae bacterium]